MELDPIILALGGAVSALAGVVFRIQDQRAKRAEEEVIYWRDKALASIGLAAIATDEAEKRRGRK